MRTRAPGPAATDIVLVGGGHAHVHVLRAFAMRPEPRVRITLVAKDLETPYSGMLPGVVAGRYARDEILIDLWRLARACGARLIHAEAIGLDRAARRVLLKDRPPLAYDVVSFDVGIAPGLKDVSGAERAIAVKPIGLFLDRFEAFRRAALTPDGPRRVVVAGGGAAGVELALSVAARVRADAPDAGLDPAAFRFALLAGGGLLPGYSKRVQDIFFEALLKTDIAFRDGARLAAIEHGRVMLADGRFEDADAVLIATAAAPHPITAALDLPLDAGGFLAVDATLRSPADPRVFAVGDCAGVAAHPRPKAGVFAVRQGPPLAANLRRAVRGASPKPFTPQTQYLSLITRGDGTAVAARGGLVMAGRGAWLLKDAIDRRWLAMYRDLPAMDGRRGPAPASDDPAMRCGGCAAKVGPAPLARALKRLGDGVALKAPDDAAALPRADGSFDLHTVDLFKAFIDDPYVFGQVSAVHALGDVYAMGGAPRHALAIATVPPEAAAKQEDALVQLMAGAGRVLAPLGVAIVGGHSGEAAELALGFAVTGEATADALTRKSGLAPGDALILTKALGSGVLIAADMRAQAPGVAMAAALAAMRRPVAVDAAALAAHGVRAATDVTGFGLVGHLVEMLDASGVAADIDPDALPLLPGVATLAGRGFASTALPQTLAALPRVEHAATVPFWLKAVLFDPQTAGGLLAGVPMDRAAACLDALHAAGAADAAIVGRVTAREAARADVRLVRLSAA